jgi:glutamate synthase domain-containing protein 1
VKKDLRRLTFTKEEYRHDYSYCYRMAKSDSACLDNMIELLTLTGTFVTSCNDDVNTGSMGW